MSLPTSFNTTTRQFLIHFAVGAFNTQYGYNYDHSKFDVVSIPPNTTSFAAFEIYTTRFDDFLRLRLYCNIGDINHVGPYQLFDSMNGGLGLGDEVFVADCLVDQEFLYPDNNIIRQTAPVLMTNVNSLAIIIDENGIDALLMEDGDYILLENGV